MVKRKTRKITKKRKNTGVSRTTVRFTRRKVKRTKLNQPNWLGGGKRVDFFKTQKKNIPVNMFKDKDRDGVYDVFDCKPNNKNKQGLIDSAIKVVKGEMGVGTAIRKSFDSTHRALHFRAPNKAYERQRAAKYYKKRIEKIDSDEAGGSKTLKAVKSSSKSSSSKSSKGKGGKISEDQMIYKTASPAERKEHIRYRAFKRGKTQAKKRKKFHTAAIEQTFPVPSLTSYGSNAKTVAGTPSRGRGRPRGSYDKRYAAYGGVIGYRKWKSAQRKALSEELKKGPPQEQQIPEELQGQGIITQEQADQMDQEVPQDEQYPQEQYPQEQVQQQVQQYPQQQVQQYPQQQVQQYPQQSQQRQIRTPFKSSGGSPYPPVNRQKLASGQQTVPYGYVESVDAFTGRRFMKKLPQKEGWS